MTAMPVRGLRARLAIGSAVATLALTVPAAPAAAAISWTPCADGFQCGSISVPLSYDDPRGARITIALTRLPATDPSRRIGSLVINPGGPGLSGIDFARTYLRDLPAALRARFDIVDFDSRGLGSSTALRCYDTAAEEQADRAPFRYPDTPAEEEVWRRADDKLAAACARHGGPILDHMSSADVARDLDLIRVRLGDRKLTYVGYSYGSLLGQTYANLFPDHFRALVIDGVVDPVVATQGPPPQGLTTPAATRMAAAGGAGQTLDQFFQHCDAAGAACEFSGHSAARFARLAARLRGHPAPIVDPATGQARTLTYNDFIGTALGAMWTAENWPGFGHFLASVESQLESAVTPRRAVAAAAQENYPNLWEGEPGVACSDQVNPRSFPAWQRAADRAERQYGYFGRIYAWVWSQCRSWPLSAGRDGYHGPWTARTAAPVLIVGNYYDPATPYAGAVGASRLLPDSRLLSYAGWGHVAFHFRHNACVDNAVVEYLVTDRLPAPGTVCQPDPPFRVAS